jgi:hypothetical protein
MTTYVLVFVVGVAEIGDWLLLSPMALVVTVSGSSKLT